MYLFGDSFDFYSAVADMGLGYWDSASLTAITLGAGRFTGSQAMGSAGAGAPMTSKSSGSNDATHHIVCAFKQNPALSGTTTGMAIALLDGTNTQMTIAFRSDGAILLYSGTTSGTLLGTYTGAFTAGTWVAYEFEVTIHNTAGAIHVRANGNSVDDFALTSVNTRAGSTNNYANKLTIALTSPGTPLGGSSAHAIDDLLWFSTGGSAPNTWVGDVRSYPRMAATDGTTQFTKFPASNTYAGGITSTATRGANTVHIATFTALYTGTCSGGTFTCSAGATANVKVALYDNATNTLLTATPATVSNPVSGVNTYTFGTPVTITQGQVINVAINQDANVTYNTSGSGNGSQATSTYSSFPPTNLPTMTLTGSATCSMTISNTINAQMVGEAKEDGTASYVFDNTATHNDLYHVAALGSTPASVIAVTTRALMNKSDAGTRTAAVQLKSGSTQVQSSTLNLSTTFGWAYRTDTVDPDTSAAWTPSGVSAAQIGPVVVS